MLWTGYVVSALPCLMLFFSAAAKFIKPAGIEEGLRQIG